MKTIQNIRCQIKALGFSSLPLGLLFVLATTAHATPAILDVRDIDTPGADSVIHVGGLTDGVSAYVDRESTQHWDNVPESLEGADYIESAQNNADVSDDRPPPFDTLLIEVDVAEGAVLYMFIDERLPTIPFPWMNVAGSGADWVDTGLDIFWHRPDFQILSCFDIWRTVGPLDAGTYNFRQMPEDAAFYGIAATFAAIPDTGVRGCVATVLVAIDIKPGSFPNSVNLGSGGTTTVAVLGSEDLDVNDIDPGTLTLGTSGVKTVGKTDRTMCSVVDVSGDFSFGPEGAPDGFNDLVCHFATFSVVPEDGDAEAKLSGEFFGGTPIEGTDSVNIVP